MNFLYYQGIHFYTWIWFFQYIFFLKTSTLKGKQKFSRCCMEPLSCKESK